MRLMQQLVEAEGFCCIFGYFMAKRDIGTKALADHLGVSDRTIRNWKARIRDRETVCQGVRRPSCRYCKTSSSTSGTGKAFSTSR